MYLRGSLRRCCWGLGISESEELSSSDEGVSLIFRLFFPAGGGYWKLGRRLRAARSASDLIA